MVTSNGFDQKESFPAARLRVVRVTLAHRPLLMRLSAGTKSSRQSTDGKKPRVARAWLLFFSENV
jgi:hypothetical protein